MRYKRLECEFVSFNRSVRMGINFQRAITFPVSGITAAMIVQQIPTVAIV